MALQVKEFLGTTGSQYWTWKIRVIEDNYIENDLVSTNKVTITIESYLGRTTVAGNSFFDGRATLNFSAGSQESGPVSFAGGSSVNAGAWYHMASHSFIVDNTGTIDKPTQIQISGSMSGAVFSPHNASANGTLSLTPLHTPPEINNVGISEVNSTLVSLEVTNDTIVQYLSQKKFIIDTSFFDEAKISSSSIYHNNILIGTSTTNEVIVDFTNVSELMDSGTGYIALVIAVSDDLGGYITRIFNYPIIKYTKPSIEFASTNIKRKTGNGIVLTDNKATLNFIGTCYKNDDIIGNANKPTVQYKIWNINEPEYSTLETPNIANVTIKNFEINDIEYTNVYEFKIKIYDSFVTEDININLKIGKVPTGRSVWSEYKDRVDFWKLTIQNNDPFAYSTDEVIIGTWIDGKTLYRKTLVFTVLPDTINEISISDLNYDTIMIDYGASFLLNKDNSIKPITCYESSSYYIRTETNHGGKMLRVYTQGSWYYEGTITVTVKYTKTTD